MGCMIGIRLTEILHQLFIVNVTVSRASELAVTLEDRLIWSLEPVRIERCIVAKSSSSFLSRLAILYLKVSNVPQSPSGLDDAIRHHESMIRGLVFHERRVMAIDSERIFEELWDVTVASPSIPRILQKACSPIALGLCLRPASAVRCLGFRGTTS